MYYDDWSEKSFNESGTGDCICFNCHKIVQDLRDPTPSDVCPNCGKQIYSEPEHYNIHKYNGTRKFDWKGQTGGLIGAIIILAIFFIVGLIMLPIAPVFGLIWLCALSVIIFVVIKATIGERISVNTKTYIGRIIGISYAYGKLARVESIVPDNAPHADTSSYRAQTQFVRYTVSFTQDGTNILTYVYDIGSHSHFAPNDIVKVCIKDNHKIWLQDK